MLSKQLWVLAALSMQHPNGYGWHQLGKGLWNPGLTSRAIHLLTPGTQYWSRDRHGTQAGPHALFTGIVELSGMD